MLNWIFYEKKHKQIKLFNFGAIYKKKKKKTSKAKNNLRQNVLQTLQLFCANNVQRQKTEYQQNEPVVQEINKKIKNQNLQTGGVGSPANLCVNSSKERYVIMPSWRASLLHKKKTNN